MNNSIKKWYALYTKAGCEKKVANFLLRKNIENYCPLVHQEFGRKKVVLEPLFNNFVFVQITDNEMYQFPLGGNIVNFVYWLGKPAVIQNEEISVMKRFLNEYINVKLEKMPFGIESKVRVVESAITDNNANLVFVKNNTVKITLPSLGYMMLAETAHSTASIYTPSNQSYSVNGKYQFAI